MTKIKLRRLVEGASYTKMVLSSLGRGKDTKSGQEFWVLDQKRSEIAVLGQEMET